jgi:hypothetical protein
MRTPSLILIPQGPRRRWIVFRGNMPTVLSLVSDRSPDSLSSLNWISGLFIAANPKNNQTIQSHFVSRDAVQAECNVAFAALNVTIPEAPQVNDITERYGGRDMRPFNTFFTSGSREYT